MSIIRLSTAEEIISYMEAHKGELAVSIYKVLETGIFCSLPVEDAVLYNENVTCGELLPYMDSKYSGFDCELIWAKIKHDRATKTNHERAV
jgi:hypothetical protein